MPDQLFEQFQLDVTPPPVQDVRRRGDRRRRRTRVAAVGATIAAVAVAGVTAVAGNGSDHAGPATQSGWVTTIAPDFPLALGTSNPKAPIAIEPGRSIDPGFTPQVVRTLDECGQRLTWVTDDSTVAGVRVEATDQPQTRTLAVFADADAAAGRLEAIRSLVRDCSTDIIVPLRSSAVVNAPTGDEGFAWTSPDQHLTPVTLLVRVGNAVLLEQTPGGANEESAVRWAQSRVGRVVAAMAGYGASCLQMACVATASPNPTQPNHSASTTLGDIPADLPFGVSALDVGANPIQAVVVPKLNAISRMIVPHLE